MSARDDGGSAFPTSATDSTDGGTFVIHRGGMTLRDYFAGQALQGICANPDISKWCADNELKTAMVRVDYVMSAYAIADAMLTERAK